MDRSDKKPSNTREEAEEVPEKTEKKGRSGEEGRQGVQVEKAPAGRVDPPPTHSATARLSFPRKLPEGFMWLMVPGQVHHHNNGEAWQRRGITAGGKDGNRKKEAEKS